MSVQSEANKLIKRFNSTNPYVVAKGLDYDVIPHQMDSDTWGQTIRSNRICSIFINDRLSEQTKLYVVSHELGHCRLHTGYNTPFLRSTAGGFNIPYIEREANEFAFAFLLADVDRDYEISKLDILKYYGLPESMERFIKIQ